ncbi:MAG: hypothetical protein WC879_03540 [Melioribacteraceae bacterium]
MKINKRFKPEKAVGKSDDPASVKTKILITGTQAISTDGRILALIPIEIEKGDAIRNYMDPYVFIEARKYGTDEESDFLEMKLNGVDAEGKVSFKNGIELPYQLVKVDTELVPYDYKTIIPTDKPKCSFSLDLSLLNKLAAALGSKSLTLIYYGSNAVIKVIPANPISNEEGYLALLRNDE